MSCSISVKLLLVALNKVTWSLIRGECGLGPRPTNDMSIKFEIIPKFEVLWFKMHSTNHNEILHMCKIALWLVEHLLNYNILNFDRIWNSTEISLVGWAHGLTWFFLPFLWGTCNITAMLAHSSSFSCPFEVLLMIIQQQFRSCYRNSLDPGRFEINFV